MAEYFDKEHKLILQNIYIVYVKIIIAAAWLSRLERRSHNP